MKSFIGNALWKLLFLFLAVSFADSAAQIALGAFDDVGLPPEMVVMEEVGNAFAAVGWFVVLILSFRKNPLIAPELSWFLAGMFFFDIQTTWPLDMPLPPYFLVWGTVLVFIQIAAGFSLLKKRKLLKIGRSEEAVGGDLWLKLVIILPVLSFSSSVWGLLNGDFDSSGIPLGVISLHTWVNGFEAVGWLLILFSPLIESVRKHAHKLAVFLAGMWCWDMITTMNLAMPVPPQQIVWGPVSVAIMLLTAYQLNEKNKQIQDI
ncbi:MAG: hypothetical protein L3J58_01650 [Emcibacter sp.]|nr:hypothetical protein [Emcibacter sp.]